jgi:hypothetical protein
MAPSLLIDCPQPLLNNLSQPNEIADFESRYAPARYEVPRKNASVGGSRKSLHSNAKALKGNAAEKSGCTPDFDRFRKGVDESAVDGLGSSERSRGNFRIAGRVK